MGRKSLYKLFMYITDNCVHNSRNRLLQHICFLRNAIKQIPFSLSSLLSYFSVYMIPCYFHSFLFFFRFFFYLFYSSFFSAFTASFFSFLLAFICHSFLSTADNPFVCSLTHTNTTPLHHSASRTAHHTP